MTTDASFEAPDNHSGPGGSPNSIALPPVGSSAIDAYRFAWAALASDPARWIACGTALIAASAVLNMASARVVVPLLNAGDGFGPSRLFGPLVVAAIIGAGIMIMQAVLVRGALDVVQGERFDPLSAASRLGLVRLAGTAAVVSLGIWLGVMLCVLPGLVFAVLSLFAVPLVLAGPVNPIAAVGRSVSLVCRNPGRVFGVLVLAGLVLVLGLMAFCIGVVAAVPVISLALTATFCQLQDGDMSS